MSHIHLDLRYIELTRRAGITEQEFHHQHLSVDLPISGVALILVDVWSDHYVKSHLERGREITLSRIKPVLEAFRAMGGLVVHAPSPACAKKYPAWTHFAGDEEAFGSPSTPQDDWPPKEFRLKFGDYEKWARPKAPQDQVFDDILRDRSIIPEVAPQEGDFVVVTGSQLHRALKANRVLHLFYAGFAANICVPFRDYGMRAMKSRGYDVVLIRDCTTAIEVSETIDDQLLTKAAIIDVEAHIGTTVSSSEMIAACQHSERAAPEASTDT